ncbi:hypothetical protein ScPMuIL_005391 [Solemya velum]
MALVTVQRSPSPSGSPDSENLDSAENKEELLKSPGRQKRPKSTLKKLKKLFHTVRFISKLKPCFSESYFAVKGAALILPQSDYEGIYSKRISRDRNSGDIQSHLQSMFYLLRPSDTIKVAVKLESAVPTRNRYLAVVSCIGRQDTEEAILLGIDCQEKATIGLVLPIWANTTVKLDGEGFTNGFSVTSSSRPYLFKPVSIQAMWSVLQTLNKTMEIANHHSYMIRGLTHTWVGFYESKINTEDFASLSEWYVMKVLDHCKKTASLPEISVNDTLKKSIRQELKTVMMSVNLDDVSVKFLHVKLEENMGMCLKEYKNFIDDEMLIVLGQMDAASKIKDFLFLGSEWNASNLNELKANGVGHILNISREIDNFFPGYIEYMNIREWDVCETDLLKYWNNTYDFIQKARKMGSKVLVHCRMGISRSASTVMAYLMKEYRMSANEAYDYVKEKRSCVHPNDAFWEQLQTYGSMLKAWYKMLVLISKSEPDLCGLGDRKRASDEIGPYGDLLGADLFIHSPEEWLDVEKSTLHKQFSVPDECPIEQDFELSSRDSAEESLQDFPSPTQVKGSAAESNSFEFSEKIPEISVKGEASVSRTGSTISDTAGSKIRPDNSWIVEVEDEDGNEGVFEIQTSSNDDDDDDKVSGIWMTTGSHDDSATTDSFERILEEEGADMEVESCPDSTGTGISEHYVKENIPWNPGTVMKQKCDLEARLKTNNQKSEEGDSQVMIYIEGIPWIPNTEENNVQSTDLSNTSQEDSSDETFTLPLKTSLSCSDLVDDEEGGPRPSFTVYDQEDIVLEPGTVQKARQEIEERNRLWNNSLETASPLTRSASLRVKRVTPKSKDRDNERRRTCTPVMSPRSVSTPNLYLGEKNALTQENIDTALSITDLTSRDHDTKEGVKSPYDSDPSMEIENVAIYKFGDEEVQVEKGIVKRQKMDIELKSKESSPFPEHIGNCIPVDFILQTDGLTENKETKLSPLDLQQSFQKQTNIDSVLPVDTKLLADPECDTLQLEVGEMPADKSTINDDHNLVHAAFKKFASEDKPKLPSKSARFDTKTLALIRDIGSALLSCPAQKTVKEKEEDSEEKSGLVKYFVRNIEGKSSVKKPKKDIVIVDKGPHKEISQEREARSESLDSEKLKLTFNENVAKKGSAQTDSTNRKPVAASSSVSSESPMDTESAPQLEHQDVHDTDCAGQSSDDEFPGEHLVKCLVGKFELSDKNENLISPVDLTTKQSLSALQTPLKDVILELKNEPNKEKTVLQSEHCSEELGKSSSTFSLKKKTQSVRCAEGHRPTARPKSAEHSERSLAHWHIGSDPSTQEETVFTWEGKKVRKLTGKSHPLTKLENQGYWTQRNNPFYNTM